jgi:hypothetical protein
METYGVFPRDFGASQNPISLFQITNKNKISWKIKKLRFLLSAV